MEDNKKIIPLKLTRDSIQNLYTNLGVDIEDKKTGNEYSSTQKEESALEAAYASSASATKFVDQLPYDMLREGFNLVFEDQDVRTKVYEELTRLNFVKKIFSAMKWSRLYGGAALFLMFDSNTSQDQPIEESQIRSIKFVTVLDRTEITPETGSIEKDITKEGYGKPTLYTVVSSGVNLKIHKSRLILFTGDELPKRMNEENLYWGISPLSKFYDSCLHYDTVHAHTASIVEDFIQKTCKIDGYNDLVATTEGREALSTKMKAMRRYASLRNIVFGDIKDEYSLSSVNIAGLNDLVEILKNKMVADSNMPHNIILGGKLGGGLNNDGTSESRVWYDFVKKKQESELKPTIEKFCDLILRQTTVFPKISDDKKSFEVVFEPLWQLSDTEKATLHKTQAEADSAYIDRGVLSEEEVRQSRFKDGQFSVETVLLSDKAPNNIDVQE